MLGTVPPQILGRKEPIPANVGEKTSLNNVRELVKGNLSAIVGNDTKQKSKETVDPGTCLSRTRNDLERTQVTSCRGNQSDGTDALRLFERKDSHKIRGDENIGTSTSVSLRKMYCLNITKLPPRERRKIAGQIMLQGSTSLRREQKKSKTVILREIVKKKCPQGCLKWRKEEGSFAIKGGGLKNS